PKLSLPSIQRAQGRPGARCTRGLVCNVHEKCAHEHTGPAESIRPSLRNGFTAYSVLSPENGSFASVAPQKLLPPGALTPAPRRQDHTPLPYASAAIVCRSFRVHRSPSHVRDDHDTPLWAGRDGDGYSPDLAFGKSEIFFISGLDTISENRNALPRRPKALTRPDLAPIER